MKINQTRIRNFQMLVLLIVGAAIIYAIGYSVGARDSYLRIIAGLQ